MLSKFIPNTYKKSIFEITPEFLKDHGIKGIITDLDNTLVGWDCPYATPEIVKWFQLLTSEGVKVVIVSNNNKERVGAFANPHRIPFVHKARKPRLKSFLHALRLLEMKKDEVCVIGDQLLTDVLGGNRLGVHTILVVPVVKTDGFWTRFNRKAERMILNRLRKKGLLDWEEVQ